MTLHQQNKFSLLELSPWSDTARLHTYPGTRGYYLTAGLLSKLFKQKEEKTKQKGNGSQTKNI